MPTKKIIETMKASCCAHCRRFLRLPDPEGIELRETSECGVCLGFFSGDLAPRVIDAIRSTAAPYGGVEHNFLCKNTDDHRLSAPGDIVARFHALSRAHNGAMSHFAQSIKNRAKSLLQECIEEVTAPDLDISTYPAIVRSEEQGFLHVYVLLMPATGVPRPSLIDAQASGNRNRKRKQHHEDSQGGDPRTNLEDRIKSRDGMITFTINQALAQLPSTPDMNMSTAISSPGLDIHVAIWRRPIYVMGKYTKSRRDISQTPFYVVEKGQKRRLGASSVEEQILPVVSRHFGGISQVNNDSNKPGVRFGMAKFHASGREDMNVRMLLPAEASADQQDDGAIDGRPFVCEIMDALRLPPPDVLSRIVTDVNGSTESHPQSPTFYGQNEFGVGVAPALAFVTASKYSTLQEETERKTKYYSCLCWSKDKLPSDDASFGTYPLEIAQQTPLRVLHRRINMVRMRHILSLRVSRVDDHYFRLHLSTDAGAYVKEFVHGDLGRTSPSMASILGCRTDILELDCEGVKTD